MKKLTTIFLCAAILITTVAYINADDFSQDENLILINFYNTIPDDYEVELETVEKNYKLDKTAARYLNEMFRDMRAAGYRPVLVSAFRTAEKQRTLYRNKTKQFQDTGLPRSVSAEKARHIIAYPRSSEHEAGLAADIVAQSYQSLNKKQETTAEAKWLFENCKNYGFILRYPEDKTDVTEILYEPWHYRFVGVKAAMEMSELEMCLEEYIEYINQEE